MNAHTLALWICGGSGWQVNLRELTPSQIKIESLTKVRDKGLEKGACDLSEDAWGLPHSLPAQSSSTAQHSMRHKLAITDRHMIL
jgi:hypothetical protein